MLEINVKVLTELINSSSTENTEVQRKTKVPFHFLSSLLRFRTVWDTATQLWIVINHICLLASRSGHYTFQYNIGTSTSCYQTSCDHTCPVPSAQTHTHTRQQHDQKVRTSSPSSAAAAYQMFPCCRCGCRTGWERRWIPQRLPPSTCSQVVANCKGFGPQQHLEGFLVSPSSHLVFATAPNLEATKG